MWAGAWAALIGPLFPHPTASPAGHPRGRVSPTHSWCPAQGRGHLVAWTAHPWSQELLQGGSRGEAPLSAAAPCWDHIPRTTQGPPSSPGGSPWPVSEVLALPTIQAGRLPSGKSMSAGLLWPPPSGMGAASEATVTAQSLRVTLAVRLPNSTHADKADLQDPQLPAAPSSLH